MVVKEDPELTSSHRPRVQLHIGRFSLRVTSRLAAQLSHNQKYKEKAISRWVGGAETQSNQDFQPWHSQGRCLHKLKAYHKCGGPL